jgi:multidrug transporter EmrE-like cation transporter
VWIIWQIIAAVSITIYASMCKYYSQTSLFAGYIGLLVGVALVGWTVSFAYSKASFIQVYTIQTGMLAILGIISSLIIFGEKISLFQYIGIFLITGGTILMAFK